MSQLPMSQLSMSQLLTYWTRTASRLGLCWMALLLVGCQSSMGPMNWDTGYRQMTATDAATNAAHESTIMPNLCQIRPDDAERAGLPPGCANDFNLQQMIVEPQDLVRGRAMGPAMGAPVADAANEYLNGRERANRRRALLEQEARNAMGTNATTSDL